jgi:hypothetical protein
METRFDRWVSDMKEVSVLLVSLMQHHTVLNLHLGENITELDDDGNGRGKNDSIRPSTYRKQI